MIIIIEIIAHLNVVEVIVDQEKFLVEIKIDDDHDQGKKRNNFINSKLYIYFLDHDIVHQNIHVAINRHVHMINDVINILGHGKKNKMFFIETLRRVFYLTILLHSMDC